MKINFIALRMDEEIIYARKGDSLIVNGEVFDFSPMGDEDTLPAAAIQSPWFIGDVNKIDGELVFTLILPNPWNYSPEQAFPVPIKVFSDGLIELPAPLPLPEDEEPLEPENTPEVEESTDE